MKYLLFSSRHLDKNWDRMTALIFIVPVRVEKVYEKNVKFLLLSLDSVDTSRNAQILSGFFARQGAFPQEYFVYFKGKQRGMAKNPPKDGYLALVSTLSKSPRVRKEHGEIRPFHCCASVIK